MPTKDLKCRGAGCSHLIYRDSLTGLCRPCLDNAHRGTSQSSAAEIPPADRMEHDRQQQRQASTLSDLKKKYDLALKTIEQQERELRALGAIADGIETTVIAPRHGSGTSEATPVILASDWHTEEVITRAQVSGLNEFNPAICQQRVTKFFQSGLRLIKLLNQDVKIHTAVLALLGDFITNDIHEEAVETNALHPIHAIIQAQNMIASGIEFLLANSKYDFLIICKVGNHGRTTKKVRFATETGHSLEHLMYVHLAAYFRNEPRITFQIHEGYHHYLKIYDRTLRLHHGHAIKYAGGIGGIFIPAFKAISQWDKAKPADLDAFGHFHQTKDGSKFVSNGSLIGYNSFAVSIKADYEPPQQTLFLLDKRRGRTCTWPILLS